MVVFSRLPSRLESRTHFGAYAEGSSRFPFPSTGLLMHASHTHRLHYLSARPAHLLLRNVAHTRQSANVIMLFDRNENGLEAMAISNSCARRTPYAQRWGPLGRA